MYGFCVSRNDADGMDFLGYIRFSNTNVNILEFLPLTKLKKQRSWTIYMHNVPSPKIYD